MVFKWYSARGPREIWNLSALTLRWSHKAKDRNNVQQSKVANVTSDISRGKNSKTLLRQNLCSGLLHPRWVQGFRTSVCSPYSMLQLQLPVSVSYLSLHWNQKASLFSSYKKSSQKERQEAYGIDSTNVYNWFGIYWSCLPRGWIQKRRMWEMMRRKRRKKKADWTSFRRKSCCVTLREDLWQGPQRAWAQHLLNGHCDCPPGCWPTKYVLMKHVKQIRSMASLFLTAVVRKK